jgi:hypothetical protein
VLRIFIALKIHHPRLGLKQQTLGTISDTLTNRPPITTTTYYLPRVLLNDTHCIYCGNYNAFSFVPALSISPPETSSDIPIFKKLKIPAVPFPVQIRGSAIYNHAQTDQDIR